MGKYSVIRGFKLVLTLTTCFFIFQESASAASVQVPSMGISTIAEAMMRSRVGDTVWVESGIYRENILIAPGVTLMARSTFQSILDGGGRGTVVTMGKNTSICGFEVRNGTIGIFSNGPGNQITSCRVVKNWQTGIIVVRHLPKVEDNIIAFNRGSGIQGWDVRSSNATINHNSIAYNSNHGVAIGGSSELIMENNVIAFNERFGVKILSEEERIQISNNNFYGNLKSPRPIPDGNFSFNPAFTSPRSSLNFKSDPAQCCSAKGTDNEDLGSRITY